MRLGRGADPWIAKTVAAFLHAAGATGAGHLLLVNDGSYSGEAGVLLALSDGEVTSSRLADGRAIADLLGRALFEGAPLPAGAELVALARGRAGRRLKS